tara:strand:+ start:351 stop:2891 length:2541 start_codon:yes stop_codon:yes gene_type:complete
MSSQQCIDRVQNAVQAKLGRPLTGEELIQVFKRSDSFIQRGVDQGKDDATVEAELVEYAQDVITATIIQKNNAAKNALHTAIYVDTLTSIFGKRPDVGIEATMLGLQRDILGSRDFLGDRITSKQDAVAQAFVSDIETGNLRKVFRDMSKTGVDTDVFRAMAQLHGEKNFDGILPEAVEIATIIDKHSDMLRVEGNRYGAWTKRELGYVTRRVHDTYHINKDQDGWLSFMTDKLDLERTFPDLDDPAKLQTILTEELSQIISGVHLRHNDSLDVSGFKGFSNTAKQLSQERVFHFKDPVDEAEYLRRFGPGDLATAVVNSMTNHARDVAIIQNYGPNAKANIDRAIDIVIKRFPGDAVMKQRIATAKEKLDNKWWPTISGMAAVPGVSKAGQIAAEVDHTVRSINRLSLLPGLVLSQIPDVAIYAATVSREGRGFLTGAAEAIDGILNGVPSDVRAEIISTLGVAVDGAIASVGGRMDLNTSRAGKLSNLEQIMYKYTGSQPWTDRLRTKFAATDSHQMALRSTKAWDDLDPDYQRVLRQQGILPEEWAMISDLRQTMSDGRDYINVDKANELDERLVVAELERIGLKPTKRRIDDFRTELRDKLRGYFHDRGDEAVLSPDMKTRAIVTQGAQQGTAARVVLNQFFALKTFPIAVVQRVLGAETLGRTSDLDATALTGAKIFATDGSAFRGVAQMIVAGTALGYASMVLKDLAKGRKPRDPMDPKTIAAAMAQGGGIGIFGDFLFGDMKNRYGGNVLTTFAGPGIQDFTNIVDVFAKWKEGDPAADEMFRLILGNTPFAGTGALRTALNYAIVYEIQESLSPGSLKRTEKRIADDNDQEFFFPPSQ